MAFFSKKNEHEKLDIIKKLTDFGYDVGYHNHFESGWVLREYIQLKEKARSLGVSSPENYYEEGKKKGKLIRGQTQSGEKQTEKAPEKEGLPDMNKISGQDLPVAVDKFPFLSTPGLQELPTLIGKTRVVELPELLNGHKLLKKR